jgi:hypothetical protein
MAMSSLARETLANRVVMQSDHVCNSCSKLVAAETPICLLHIVIANVTQDDCGRVFEVPLPLLAADGEYQYHPYYLHEDCWDETRSTLRYIYKDQPPVLVSGAFVVAACTGCGSDILQGEKTGIVYDGSFVLSDRAPNREWALDFITIPPFEYICSVCCNDINLNLLEGLWGTGEHILQNNECVEGITTRCWRNGPCNRAAGYCIARRNT